MTAGLGKVAILFVGALIFTSSLVQSAQVYEFNVNKRKDAAAEIQKLKREPREWLIKNFPLGTRICVETDSTWSLPSLHGFVPVDGVMKLPYLDPVALMKATPPTIDALRAFCKLLITSDHHRATYDRLIERASPENAAKWRRFFAEVSEKFPPIVFRSPVAVHAKAVMINDLR